MNTESNANLPREDKTVVQRRILHFAVIVVVLLIFVALLLPAFQGGRGTPSLRSHCFNNLKQIALGLRNYELTYGELPPAYTADATGCPLHSWRTLILPFMESTSVYQTIDLTKPWDDPVNKAVSDKPFWPYVCPAFEGPTNHTTYLAIVAPGGCFRAREGRKLSDITDRHETTIMVIEVDSKHSVPWMSPQDADEELVLGLTSSDTIPHFSRYCGVNVDGRGTFLRTDVDASKLRAMISIAGGDDDVLLED